MQERLFKLGTTSFIVPDHIIPNVKKLGPWFDEIELLVFESRPETVLPSEQDVKTLAALAEQHRITYNIHLPVDISLSSGTAGHRQKAGQTLVEVIRRFSVLNPTTCTLHLDLPQQIRTGSNDLKIQWKKELKQMLADFSGRLENPGNLSIETLDYPFSMVEDIVQALRLPVCLDVGHGIKYGYDWEKIARTHKKRLPLVHLHGVDLNAFPAKDHTGLDCLEKKDLAGVLAFLNTYTGVVSLEVFNRENLIRSLDLLAKYYTHIPNLQADF